jgi:hypothetical protein
MNVGVGVILYRDQKVKLKDLQDSHTLGGVGKGRVMDRDCGTRIRGESFESVRVSV